MVKEKALHWTRTIREPKKYSYRLKLFFVFLKKNVLPKLVSGSATKNNRQTTATFDCEGSRDVCFSINIYIYTHTQV